MADVTLFGAALGGLLSFVSPCLLPLFPSYVCFLAGVTLDELAAEGEAKAHRLRIMAAALAFVLGFSIVFVGLGASASFFGQFVRWLITFDITILGRPIGVLSLVAGGIIIAMGLHFLGVFQFAFLHRERRMQIRQQPAGPFGAFFVGVAFAIGWTPCIGPVLGTILFVAGAEESALRGALLLFAYSLGMGVPFLLAALFAGPFMRLMARFRGQLRHVEQVMGGLLVMTGILFITGQMTLFSTWLQSIFPEGWLLG